MGERAVNCHDSGGDGRVVSWEAGVKDAVRAGGGRSNTDNNSGL